MISEHLRPIGLLLALPLVLGCVSSKDIDAVNAQLADIQRQILQLRMQASSKEEVAGMERNITTEMGDLLKSEADMQVQLQNLSQQIEQLQANLEDNTYRQTQLSQQLAAIQQQLQAGRSELPAGEVGESEAAEGNDAADAPTVVATDPKALYDTAYSDYLRGNYELAILGFQEYLERFPQTSLTDNAHYWIGESYYGQGDYERSIQEFNVILDRFSQSDKAPAAQLKKAYANLQAGHREGAIVQLQALVRDHPATAEADLARERLSEMGVD